jgi:hypothetical protein
MPRKLKITLWVVIGLLAAILPAIVWAPFPAFNLFMTIFGLIFACGVLIVCWTRGFWIKRVIKERNLKRYLLMAGASAMVNFFFAAIAVALGLGEESSIVVPMVVCPIALVVGLVLALRFKVSPQAS